MLMIIIRHEQQNKLELPKLIKMVIELCKEARNRFNDELADVTEKSLGKKILNTVKKAEKYNLVKESDYGTFVNIAIEYGWDFDEDPDNEWMVDILEDPEISNPSDRLNRLVDECRYRKEVAEQNENLWDEFYGTDSDDNDDFDDEDFDEESSGGAERNEISV